MQRPLVFRNTRQLEPVLKAPMYKRPPRPSSRGSLPLWSSQDLRPNFKRNSF